jgi:hypothetical protein
MSHYFSTTVLIAGKHEDIANFHTRLMAKEFADSSVLIFSPILTHSDVARWVDKEAVSAGMACFPTCAAKATSSSAHPHRSVWTQTRTWHWSIPPGLAGC